VTGVEVRAAVHVPVVHVFVVHVSVMHISVMIFVMLVVLIMVVVLRGIGESRRARQQGYHHRCHDSSFHD
jgi:hypothetical protein